MFKWNGSQSRGKIIKMCKLEPIEHVNDIFCFASNNKAKNASIVGEKANKKRLAFVHSTLRNQR